jgi:CheY-like chemotaxis protein
LDLINDVLEISQIEAGRLTRLDSVFDLWNMLQVVEEMTQVKAKAKGLPFVLDFEANTPRYIESDEKKLKQILLNLAGNAIKFTQTGRVTLKVRINTSLKILTFEIIDTGPGIAEADIPRLFAPFEQAGQNREGAGLGLYISRKFVELLGGHIDVKSTVGKGSTFSFNIHYTSNDRFVIPPEKTSYRVVGIAPGQKISCILVAEDQLDNLRFVVHLLKSAGLIVVEAHDGEEAVQIFEKHHPDLVLMDLRMPFMDGIESSRRIRAIDAGKSVPIIIVTASVFEEQRQQILKEGVDDFIRKPIDTGELFQKLQQYLKIQFTYEPVIEVKSDFFDKRKLQDMFNSIPEHIAMELRQAVRDLDLTQFKTLLSQLSTQESFLGMKLREMADGYEINLLADIVEGSEDKSNGL